MKSQDWLLWPPAMPPIHTATPQFSDCMYRQHRAQTRNNDELKCAYKDSDLCLYVRYWKVFFININNELIWHSLLDFISFIIQKKIFFICLDQLLQWIITSNSFWFLSSEYFIWDNNFVAFSTHRISCGGRFGARE